MFWFLILVSDKQGIRTFFHIEGAQMFQEGVISRPFEAT